MKTNTAIEMTAIGTVEQTSGGSFIRLRKELAAGLTGLDGFSHAAVFWHFDKAPWDGKTLSYASPYKSFKGELGIFATRGPFRPNGIALSVCRILEVDADSGILSLDWIDAEPESPVLDIKPFHPSSDVITNPSVPDWCAHWPKNRESSADFDWTSEFAFG